MKIEIEIKNNTVIELYKYNYDKYLRRMSNNIKNENISKAFENIHEWENKPLPLSDIKNHYSPTIEWMPYYAIGDIEGLHKVHNKLKKLGLKREIFFYLLNSLEKFINYLFFLIH